MVIYVGIVPIVWLFVLELFRQCGYFCWNCSYSVVICVRTVPTVWLFFFWNCSDSVVICVGTVPTVWLFVVELIRQCGYLW